MVFSIGDTKLLTLVWKWLMCDLCPMSWWHPNCLHCQRKVFQLHYPIDMGYWLTQVISIFKCCLYQYLEESIRKRSSKICSAWTERQTIHPMSTLHGQAQDGHCKTDDEIRQNAVLDGKSCFGQVVSTKEVTDKNVWMERGQEQFWKPNGRSPEIWARAIQEGKMGVRIYAALQEANTS